MFQQPYSKDRDSIRQTRAKRHAALTCGFNNVLGRYDKLKKFEGFAFRAKRLKRYPEPPQRIARGVALILSSLLMGIGLSTPADGGLIDAIAPKRYIKLHYSHREAICLIKLYGKESAFNSKAIGNEDGLHKAYGIPQLKNELIKDLSPNRQIDYGMKYIAHRYSGSPCKALSHSNKKGWY